MQLRHTSVSIAALALLGSCQIISIDSDRQFVGISHKDPNGYDIEILEGR